MRKFRHARRLRGELMSDINITPFVDVMLVLLIIFMLTAPLLQQGLPVNLPEASAPAIKRTKQDVILTIKDNGALYLGDKKQNIPLQSLEEELRGIFSVKKEKDLFIKADADLLYGIVVRVMSIAKKAGADRIGMLTKPERG